MRAQTCGRACWVALIAALRERGKATEDHDLPLARRRAHPRSRMRFKRIGVGGGACRAVHRRLDRLDDA